MSAINRVVKNTWILYVRMGITVFMSLYATRLTLSALGVEDFGIFNLVGGTIAMLTFLNSAMTAATQRFMSYAEGAGENEKKIQIFNISTILHIIAASLIFIILEVGGIILFGHFFKIPSDRVFVSQLIWQFMVFSTIFSVISVPYDAVINAHENMLLFAIISVIEASLKLGIAIFITFTTFDKLTAFGFLTALSSVILLLIRRIYCHWKYEECIFGFKKYFSKEIFNEMFSFIGWSFLGSSSSVIGNYGQVLIINSFFGPTINSSQVVASQLSGQLSVFSNNMQRALNPYITKSEGSGNRAQMIKVTMFGSKVAYLLMLFFYAPVFLELPFIFKFWLGEVPPFAVIFCRLLLIRNLIEQFFIQLNVSISAVGNIRNYQIYYSLLNLLPLLFIYFLFYLGFNAVANYIVYLIYSILLMILTLYFSKKNFNLPINYYLRNIVVRLIVLSLITLVIPSITFFFLEENFLRLIITFLTVIILFIILVWFYGFENEEKIIISNTISQIFKKIKIFSHNKISQS